MGSGTCTARQGERSALSGTITVAQAHPKVPLKHYSEGVGGTCRLPRAFSSPVMTSEMELITSWNQNGSHPHSHPLSYTGTNSPKPKGTAKNTTFVFGADSQGLLIKRYK